ncbi:hypothetical protein JCM19379_14830 [Methyloparacoccus murrellii]
MKVRTQVETLAGNSLDWVVGYVLEGGDHELAAQASRGEYRPSSDWSIGGPLIESAQIRLSPTREGYWRATKPGEDWASVGKTPLIAAMRFLIRHRHASEIDIPWQLLDRGESFDVNPAQPSARTRH